jgi:DUF4097 and DUF4098 domain-containing protein YvlB
MKQTGLAILLLVAAPALLAAGESIDETKDASADGFVTVNVTRGEVEFRGWDKNAVRVVGTLDEETEEFRFERDGEEVRIHVKVNNQGSGWWGNNDGSDLTIYLPEESSMTFAGVSTDVEVRDINGPMEVGVVSGDLVFGAGIPRLTAQTVSGDIELRETDGRVRVTTVSGDVDSYRVKGDAEYSSVSGNILVEDGGPEMRIESVSGDIEVNNGTVSSLGGHSVSGDIDINIDPAEASNIEFDAVSGSIRVRLGGEVNARFDIETGSGSIRNRLSDHKPRISKYMSEETLKFSLGEGEGQVMITTRSGDISLSRR